MWYEREIRRKIQRLAATFPAIVVTGARQVGKTSLLRRMYPDYHFVTLDRPAYAEMAETRPDDFLRQFQAPVIIDEVQYAPALFRHLKLLIDQDRENYGQYILTGSQKFTLMKAISDSLAGRCGVCELETLSLEEIRAKKNITLEEACLAGGYPELHKRPEIHYPDYFDAYLATYLERDVRTLLQVGNLRDFERFLQACALRTAQTVNKAELARDVGVSASTANQWLSLLHASNQVLLLEPWFSNKTKSLVKSPKLYIHDTGLLCHMLQISSIQELRDSPHVGAIWETFVFSELRKKGLGSWKLWFWRDKYGLEVDFLNHVGGHFELTEAKWSQQPTLRDGSNLEKVAAILGADQINLARIICRAQGRYVLSSQNTDIVVEGWGESS